MYFVYVIKSIDYPDQIYIGYTANLSGRLEVHNTGGSPHTAKYKPWVLVSFSGFSSKDVATRFEKYLKSQSGRAFLHKRLI
ncbi:GIY-YIG nuclease family protein [Candidatus Dependentiae bacterium]|nr:GIY-YIG nuclease family protein [Candidatus Dependentiae bacterium]MCC7415162.1 GIY-YIG nuclease family protein [Campylobacterota bacterium]